MVLNLTHGVVIQYEGWYYSLTLAHSKYADLANLAPEDIEQLDYPVGASISSTRKQTHLLRSFFQTAGLAL